ncbi:Ethanolamine utilization protein EutD [Pseudoruegeria aquimaris]|uniref:Ethanolamine utilization protein EutD n=1 Tax=Pseudoruegeria aquimaris TaxID=393663 RepID=A0A1Y5T193_9RHOB|nr:phosphate acyltransferase [Pseudoruegeria aquimaris]SLN49776.1 Ethanolamine utilization protein EutD [Pseudoruegeria aquimaris]
MSVLENVYESARARQARVILPEAEDARIAQAAERLVAEGLARPVPLADASEAHVAAILKQRPGKEAFARRLLEKPLVRAAAMVACGEADALVAGAASPTRRVIEAAQFAIGMAEGIALPSSSFLMRFPDGREALFADCALNVAPDADGLADIATASAATARALLGRAEVAFLSFSTLASGAGESVDRVRSATETARARGLAAIGPVQADAALNPEIATRKGIEAGAPNVFIFPSLDAGNIAYKLAQELAGAQALGPLLQGFGKPVCDLSRGASVEDIVAATAVTLALAQ